MRTALRSLVARDIRSPVRPRLVVAERLLPRAALKKSLRMSYSMSRDAAMMMRRIRNEEQARGTERHCRPAGRRKGSASGCVDAAVEIVDGVLEHPRPEQLERGGRDDADEAREQTRGDSD
jgi:hypothetical protein